MCLASAFLEDKNESKLMMDRVSYMEIKPSEIICHDLFGQTLKIQGIVQSIDFADSKIVIQPESGKVG